MPKRVVDGEALWGSDKLNQVHPERFRAEFATLVPLALANGSFECDARKIWSRVFSFNRPDVPVEQVETMLDEFERVKMLFRWTAADGKVWGHWVGSDKPGRLPAPSQIKKGEKTGAPVPQDQLQAFLRRDSPRPSKGEPQGTPGKAQGDSLAGSGNGNGKGSGYAGGAGGRAPASGGQSSGDEEDSSARTGSLLAASFSSENNDTPPAPAPAPTSASPPARPPQEPRATVLRADRDAALIPSEPQDQPPASTRVTIAPRIPAREEPWDALDFAMTRTEPFAGFEPTTLQRIVFYHWKIAQPYWSTPQGNVTSPARLEKALPTMFNQTPADFRVSGSATLVLPQGEGDPNCGLCGGSGIIPGPNEAYEGELGYLQANPCACQRVNTKPWRDWKKGTNND